MIQLTKSIDYIDMTNYDLNSDDSLDLKSKSQKVKVTQLSCIGKNLVQP